MKKIDQPLVSIIVPVYNVRKYFDCCMRSIFIQSYKKLEIILVDDGSTDGCDKMCDGYAEKDSRVKVFHQKNQGVSSARNKGLSHASGAYVAFVDPDDIVATSYIKTLLESAIKMDSDISICRFENIAESNELFKAKISKKQITILSHGEAIEDLLYNRKIHDGPFCKFYRASIIHGIYFDETLRIGEDFDFNIRVMLKAHKVCVDFSALYGYRQRNGSAIKSAYDKSHQQHIDYTLRLAKKIGMDNGDIKLTKAFKTRCFVCVSRYAKRTYAERAQVSEYEKWCDIIKKNRLAVILSRKSPIRQKAQAVLYFFGVNNINSAYTLLRRYPKARTENGEKNENW